MPSFVDNCEQSFGDNELPSCVDVYKSKYIGSAGGEPINEEAGADNNIEVICTVPRSVFASSSEIIEDINNGDERGSDNEEDQDEDGNYGGEDEDDYANDKEADNFTLAVFFRICA